MLAAMRRASSASTVPRSIAAWPSRFIASAYGCPTLIAAMSALPATTQPDYRDLLLRFAGTEMYREMILRAGGKQLV